MKNFFQVRDASRLPPHKTTITEALDEGFAFYAKQAPDPKDLFLQNFLQFQQQIRREDFFSNPKAFETEEHKLFEIIYNSKNAYNIKQKLFFEFLMGLCRFGLSIGLYIRFAEFLEQHQKVPLPPLKIPSPAPTAQQDLSSFWKYLAEMAKLGKNYIEKVIEFTKNFQKVGFWENAQAFFQDRPKLEALARGLVSMHYIPEDPEDKSILGLAQMLHWCGFGGSGILLEKYPQLEPLLIHRIGYHDRESGGFNNHFSTIFAALNASKEYADKIGGETATAVFKTRKDAIRILDVGSGPEYLAAEGIIAALQTAGKKVELTASEVDTEGVRALNKPLVPDGVLQDVRYFDLNFVGNIPEGQIPYDNFDIVTARLVLHQLNEEDIVKALTFFVKVLRPTGLIVNADVGRDGHHQALLVPANNVDREGHVPSPEGKPLVSVAMSDGTCKVAFPLRDQVRHFPNNEQRLYTYQGYQVLSGTKEQTLNLNSFWQKGNYEDAQKLATTMGLVKST